MAIFPDPLNGNVLNINNTNVISDFKIEVLSVDGKKLKEFNFTSETILKIDVSDIESGIYFIKSTHNSQSSIMKFIKE